MVGWGHELVNSLLIGWMRPWDNALFWLVVWYETVHPFLVLYWGVGCKWPRDWLGRSCILFWHARKKPTNTCLNVEVFLCKNYFTQAEIHICSIVFSLQLFINPCSKRAIFSMFYLKTFQCKIFYRSSLTILISLLSMNSAVKFFNRLLAAVD